MDRTGPLLQITKMHRGQTIMVRRLTAVAMAIVCTSAEFQQFYKKSLEMLRNKCQ